MHKILLVNSILLFISVDTYSQTKDLSLDQAWEKAYQDYPESL